VTAIRSHHLREHIFAVGSYDSHIRILDARSPQFPLAAFSAGGGIWRLKWHPTDPCRLLAAAMHNGFQIIDWTDGFRHDGEEAVRLDEHGGDSLAYGADWGKDGNMVGSCSFYDHKVCFWNAGGGPVPL
jgi:diphthamide biosynthesis protein 7